MKRKNNTKGIVKDTSLAAPAVTDAEVPSYIYGPGYQFDLGKEGDILSKLGRELAEQEKVNVTSLFQSSFNTRPSAM